MNEQEKDIMMVAMMALSKTNLELIKEIAQYKEDIGHWISEYSKLEGEYIALMEDIANSPEDKDMIIANLRDTVSYLESMLLDGKRIEPPDLTED